MEFSFGEVWGRIEQYAGAEFRQKRGGVFTYEVVGNLIVPDRTDHRFARSQVEEAYHRMPVEGPGRLNDLRGPSYLFAILMDDRIRQGEW